MTPFTFMMVLALAIGGLGVALLGSIKVALARRLAIDEARVGGLVSLFGFALIPGNLMAGFLTDLVGRQVVLVGGSVLIALSIGLLAGARKYRLALAAVILFSMGWSLLINVGNVLVPLAFAGSKAQSNNLANVFFGLGAFFTPLATAFCLGRVSLGSFLAGVAGFALLPGALALVIAPTAFLGEAGERATAASVAAEHSFRALLHDPKMWLFGFALFFYGPLEASLAAWTTTFLGEKGMKEKSAATMLSAFWLTYMAARLVTAFTLPPDVEIPFLLALAVGTAAMIAIGVLGKGLMAGVTMVLGAGLCLGPIFPTVMGLLQASFPEELRGRAVGMFFSVGGVGWTLIPIALGAYAQKTNLSRAFVIAIGTALGLAAVVGGLGFALGRL